MSPKKKKPWAENGLEDWGSYMAAKKQKLEEQFDEEAKKDFQDATSLFKGIAIFVNGYTNPCADELKRLMMAHGGIYHHYLRSRITTHIIASNLPYSKIVAYRKSHNPLPICKPEWVTDSLKANKVLDWRPYVLYSNATVTQPQLQFVGKISDSVGSAITGKIDQRTCRTASADNTDSVEISHNSAKKNDVPGFSSTEKSNSGGLCTKNSEFLTEFYNNSRLHHISTMGATFKDYVNELRAKNFGTFHGLDRLRQLKKTVVPYSPVRNESDSEEDLFDARPERPEKLAKHTVIMHIDMDCFFVSVGLRDKPELRGLPVAVTHAKGNKPISKLSSNRNNEDSNRKEDYGSMAEIASCSYEARKAGLKNGMFLGQALKLSPNLKTISYDFEGYKEVSYILYDTVASYTLNIEAVSCDEMYADITSVLEHSRLTPLEFASVIRAEIKEKTRCPVSTGFGCNKLQARLATRKAKPDGQFYLETAKVQDFMESMIVRDLPGVGSSTMHLLQRMNVRTCSDLEKVSLSGLQKKFGKKTGEMLHNMCRGVDNSKLNFEHVRKSVSAEVNYGIRFETGNDAEFFLRKLSQEVANRLQKANAKGRSVTLKLMIRAKDAPKEAIKFMGHGVCDHFTKSKSLVAPINDPVLIAKEVLLLWNQMQQVPADVRGIGIQMARLEPLKSRLGSANMMNFFKTAKHNYFERESTVSRILTSELDVRSTKNINIAECQTNEKVVSKSSSTTEFKPRGLKAFLVPKDHLPSKSDGFSNSRPTASSEIGEIDESVLAELPADIQMEILKSRSYCRSPDKADPQGSAGTSSNSFRNGHLGAPLRLNDEEQNILPQSLVTAGADPTLKNIDESVLNELPEDIRDEILGFMILGNRIMIGKTERTSKPRQTQQESFFKHTKSGFGKSDKANMPPIEEINMAVLIELPEDIRNEIINEYKAKKQGKSSDAVKNEDVDGKKRLNVERHGRSRNNANLRIVEEANVSFSQVDSAFLAALSEDLKTDVQMYCMAKKKQKFSKATKLDSDDVTVSTVATKNRNPLKQNKTMSVLIKSKTTKKTMAMTESANERNNVKKSPEIAISDRNAERTIDDNRTGRFLEDEFTVNREASASLKQRQEIISHHSSFTGNRARTDEHSEILTSLVDYLFTLPVQQVKMQIKTWIYNSNDVNEIDLLSLATFLSMLPKKKRLEDLHILLKTMHRCITRTGRCVWHEAYIKTVDNVQRYMQIEYNSNLMLPRIECERRECGN